MIVGVVPVPVVPENVIQAKPDTSIEDLEHGRAANSGKYLRNEGSWASKSPNSEDARIHQPRVADTSETIRAFKPHGDSDDGAWGIQLVANPAFRRVRIFGHYQVRVDTVCISIHKQDAPIVANVSTLDLPSALHSRCDAVNAREEHRTQLLFLGFIGGAVAA